MNWTDAVGWIGFCFILGCYLMVALQRWSVRSYQNQSGNFLGSVALAVNCAYYHAWAPMVLNVVWSVIATMTLYRLRKS